MKRSKNDELVMLFAGIELFWPFGVILTLAMACITAFSAGAVAGIDLENTVFAQITLLKWLPWSLPVVLLVLTLSVGFKTYRVWRRQ